MLPFSPDHLPKSLRDPRVLEAMQRIPRRMFIPEEHHAQADRDIALPIGHGQTISQPYIVAYMTAGLAVSPGDRVLEIGTGSGYQAAVLAEMGVEVFSVEVVPELSEAAKERFERLGLLGRIHLRVGDGWHGWPNEAPFQGVICSAAPDRLPPNLIEQLEIGRRIVIPIGKQDAQVLHILVRERDGLSEVSRLDVRFVPLQRPGALA